MKTRLATLDDLPQLALLFDRYRVFYQQLSDVEAAHQFLSDRLSQNDAKIFVAIEDQAIIGLAQLNPSFSSVSMQPIWILNDLYVEESHRRKGVAIALMDTAEGFSRKAGALRVQLSTQGSNTIAQRLYTQRGYQRDDEFWHYSLPLKQSQS